MASILAHIQIHPGKEAVFEDITRRLHAATHALEPACLRYEYWRAAEPGKYYCFLCFTDYPAFMVHQVSDHHEDDAATLREVIADIQLEWVDPVMPGAGFPLTRDTPIAADADALTKDYAAMFPIEIQQWWQGLRTSA